MKKTILSLLITIGMLVSMFGGLKTQASATGGNTTSSQGVCLADLECVDEGHYTGNQGDARVYRLDGQPFNGYNPTGYNGDTKRNGNVGLDGTIYQNGFEVWIARWNFGDSISWAYRTFKLGGKYQTLTGSSGIIKSYNTTNYDVTAYFYSDDDLLYSFQMTPTQNEFAFTIDVTGVNELKVLVEDNIKTSGGTSYALYNLFLDETVSFAAGDGSKNNPYQVANAAQLNAVRDDPTAHYLQIADISLSGFSSWTPIADFSGEFDGSNYCISGMSISSNNLNYLGLFGKVTGLLKNICIVDSSITGSATYVGSIAGYTKKIYNCISNCVINATCTYGGGICGYSSDSITGCTFGGVCTFSNKGSGTFEYYGGICGMATSSLASSYNYGTLSVNGSANGYLGGVAGFASQVSECCNAGDLTSSSASSSNCGGTGGIVGYGVTVTNCYSSGALKTTRSPSSLGGIMGLSQGTASLSFCYSCSTFSYKSANYVYVGGLIGAADSNYNQRIQSCYWPDGYSSLAVKIGNYTLVSSNVGKPLYLNDFHGTMSEAQFEQGEYNFSNIWTYDTTEDYPYPILRAIDYNTLTQKTCDHTWGAAETNVEPTCAEPGEVVYTCTKCGATKSMDLLPLGHNYVDGVCTRCGLNSLTTITIKYVPSDGGKAVTTLDFDYSDTFFNGSAYSYNHDLAKISLGLTMATSCNSIVNGHLMGDIYLRDSLTQIGCDPQNFYSKKFDNNTATDDTCAYMFGAKYISEQNAYLIPVVIRSANYGGEWASNVHVSEGHISTCSYGFKAAADAVYEDLQSYVAPLLPDNSSLNPGQITPKIIYWVTGFSRGGAIANLLGARLTAASNGGGSRIFVYSFATPETVKSSAYVNYKNIHNIVSEIDVVPRVPLEAWSYTRYGTTHYLPCHTTRGVQYETLLSGMQYEFNRLMTNNGCSYRNNPFYGQEVAIDLLLEYLADLAPSTDEYEDGKLQALIRGFLIQKQGNCTLEDIIYFLLEGHETEAAMLVHIISSIDDATTMQKIGYYQLAVNEILAAMLTGEDLDAETVLKGRILKVLIELLIRYDARGYAGIVFGSDCFDNYACAVLMIEDLFDNGLHSALLMQHWPETYLAWLNSSNPNNLFSDCAYVRVSVKCPVDLVVYDSNENVVARVQNDLVDTSVEHSLLVVVNGNGEKDIFLPEDEAYTVVITSRENGQLDIVETSFDLEHQLTGTACYFNLEMQENQTFLAEIDPDKEDIKVESLDNEIVADYSSEAPDKVQINISSVAPVLTYGSGEYFVGETVCLAASDSHTYSFEGWYYNGNFVSSECEIYFSAVDNCEYTAVFHEHDWNEPEYVWADDYSTVTATRVCKNNEGHVERETVYTTSEITKPATCTDMGETAYSAAFGNEAFAEQTKTVANIEMLEHSPCKPVKENETSPTCTDKGGYDMVIYCTICGAEISREHTDVTALGHDWNDGEVTIPATATTDGVKTFTCKRCGATKTETIPATGEDPCKHENAHPEHKDATCVEAGYDKMICDKCGAVIIEEILPALGHDLVADEAVAATCTDAGLTAGEHCTRCDYKVEQKPVPALGHDWDDGKVTTPATAKSDGVNTFTCKRCGATKTEAIPSTGEDKPCDGGPTCPSYKFRDVKAGDWYHEAVDFAVKNGLFNGMSDTTFEPNTPMTRGMLVTVLWRYEGQPEGGTNDFADVKDGEWYTKAVAWAASKGIVNGVGQGKFDPNGNITREQLAAILYRYSERKGFDTSKAGNLNTFPDAAKVSDWARTAYSWAVGEGLIGGSVINGRTLLDPHGNATRAQVATILMRFIRNTKEAMAYDTKGHTYEFVRGKYSWADAQRIAREKGGYLVCFDSEDEFKYVTGELMKMGYKDTIFIIGARRADSSKDYYFVDADDKAIGRKLNTASSWVSAYWASGEPTYEWEGEQEWIVAVEYKVEKAKWMFNDIPDNATYPADPNRHGFIIEYDTEPIISESLAGYAVPIQEAINLCHDEANHTKDGGGFLFDINGDGQRELILMHTMLGPNEWNPEQMFPCMVCSFFTMKDGELVPLLTQQKLFQCAGGPKGIAGVAQCDGKMYFFVTSEERYSDHPKLTSDGAWYLYEMSEASLSMSIKAEYHEVSDWSTNHPEILYSQSSAKINGSDMDYASFEAWLKTVTIIKETWGGWNGFDFAKEDGISLEDLLALVQQ